MQQQTHYYELTASKFDWKLSKTKTVNAWGFNQSVPGPVLRAKKGDTMIIKVNNELDEPIVIHWHGIRLLASMDGTGEVQDQFNRVKVLSIGLKCRIEVRFGIIHIIMKLNKWKEVCMEH